MTENLIFTFVDIQNTRTIVRKKLHNVFVSYKKEKFDSKRLLSIFSLKEG